MRSQFKRALKSRPFVLALGLGFGLILGQTINASPKQSLSAYETVKPDESIILEKNEPSFEHDQSFQEAMARMRQIQDRMMGRFFDSESSELGSGVRVSQREDDHFKYVEINTDSLTQDSLEVKIENGMIRINGQVEKTNQNEYGQSKSISSFNQSFNIPFGVDANGAQVEKNQSGITIKFPKSA